MRHMVGVLSFLLLLSLSCQRVPPDPATENRQTIRELYAAIDAQDYDRFREIFPEDALVHVIGTDETFAREAGIEMMQTFSAAFPDYAHVIDRIVAEGDWVAVQLTFHATHQGEFRGIPATGRAVTYGGAHFGRIVGGKVVEWWILENDLSLMQQLGMDLAPGGRLGEVRLREYHPPAGFPTMWTGFDADRRFLGNVRCPDDPRVLEIG